MNNHTDHPAMPKDLARAHMQERAQQLAEAVVGAFAAKLKTEIENHGGALGLEHITEIEAELQAKGRRLSALFALALEEAAREQEELRWHAIKRPAFDRLIVKRFEHLFIHRDANGTIHGMLSRRCLPGFFLALGMMLGPEVMEEYQRRCDAGVARVMGGRTPVDWERVDQDPHVHDILLDAQYAIASYFEDTLRRIAWFQHIVNTHLAPPRTAHDADANWEMTPDGMRRLAESLLSDLNATVHDDAAWKRLAARHPGTDRSRLQTLLERLR